MVQGRPRQAATRFVPATSNSVILFTALWDGDHGLRRGALFVRSVIVRHSAPASALNLIDSWSSEEGGRVVAFARLVVSPLGVNNVRPDGVPEGRCKRRDESDLTRRRNQTEDAQV